MLQGKKTYLTAGLMVVYAVSGALLGQTPEVDWRLILEAFGLVALRNAIPPRG